jgi:hypothetical protein
MITKRKYFTPDEANATLPLVRRIVSDLLDRGRALRAIQGEGPIQDAAVLDHATALEREVQELGAELEALGCRYRDWEFEVGVVDFPARIGEHEVMLCWRHDEPRIEWYHGPNQTPEQRRPLDELVGPATSDGGNEPT